MLNTQNLLEPRELSGLGPCRKSRDVGHQYINYNNLTLYITALVLPLSQNTRHAIFVLVFDAQL